ncbi:hypothetical protein ACWKSP_38935 [Micromonosporaceae bacterium Da 78-11]
MTATIDQPVTSVAAPSPPRRRVVSVAALLVAFIAGGVLLAGGEGRGRSAPVPGRLPAAAAWPKVQRANMPGSLEDGPLFSPTLFLDAGTAVGTAPTADGRWVRLIVRDRDGKVRQLYRLPARDAPQFDDFAVDGDDVVWTQSSDKVPLQIWSVNLRNGAPARLLTSDTGNAVFYGNQFDFVFADARVYWAATPGNPEHTEIRSVPLTGGQVATRTERGEWALSAWPWLTNDAAALATGTTLLRNMTTGRDLDVRFSGTESATCTPAWCRMMVINDNGDLAGIDVMHPDGSARRRIAGSGARATVTDVAVLDRFEILSEPGPNSDLTGVAGLLVYDISTGRTVDVSPAANGAFTCNGVLWWSTGEDEATIWHAIDLRTA